MQDLVLRVDPPFGIALVVGVSTVVLLWWMLPAAALILAVSLVLAATVVPWLTGLLARRREARFAAVRGDLGAAMVDLTEGAAELIAFGAADAHIRTIRNRDAELTAIASASAGTAGIGLALTTLLAGLACWGCLLVGIPAVLSGRLGGTELAVITLIPLAAFELVVGLPVATQALQRVRQAAARVFEVLDAPAPVPDPEVAVPLPGSALRPGGALGVGELPGRGGTRSSWRGPLASLRAPRGRRGAERSGQVDPGRGPGRLPAASGRLHHPVRRPGGAVVRRRPPHRGRAGRPGRLPLRHHRGRQPARRPARRHRRRNCTTCSARVGLAAWLGDLPEGLGTEVGSHGARLSGGQRQRVAVARALLADFPVLVLDEPAEHLEPAAADALTADLLDVTGGRSLVLITHRLAGLESVDEILVMEHGRVVQRGTHDELLDQAGRYSDLWWEEMRTERGARSTRRTTFSKAGPPATTADREVALNDGSFTP